MEERILLYGLLFTSTFNMILLLVLAIVMVRLVKTVQTVSNRVDLFLDNGEKEIIATIASFRKILHKSDQYVNAFVRLSEKYMVYKTVNRLASSPKISKIITGAGIGYGLVRSFMNAQSSTDSGNDSV